MEPHHLVAWAGRWCLVAHTPATGDWCIYRADRIHPHTPTGVAFARRELPDTDVARSVMTSHDRGDTPAQWQCSGVVVIDLLADVVARWAPGGSVVEHLDATRTRLTLGAWSWAGVAGLLATFDADIEIIEPDELSVACAVLARRYTRAGRRTPRTGCRVR